MNTRRCGNGSGCFLTNSEFKSKEKQEKESGYRCFFFSALASFFSFGVLDGDFFFSFLAS
ncbi:MAG: hypothetical protein JWO08_3253 [Verrucomicrobiaceae bacterium]|nr:hypothetical protein [Verrucomicrobiaceae bacterium]